MAAIAQMLRAVKRSLTATPVASKKAETQTPSPTLRLLQQWQTSRQLLAVETPRGSYQSMLLAIDVSRGLLWLDELVPGDHHLKPGDTLTLSHHSGKYILTAHTEVVGLRDHGDGLALAVILPDQINSRPRRRHWRYHPPANTMSARIRAVGDSPLNAGIINISEGGMRLSLRGNKRYHLRPGALLPLCQFDLGGLCRVRCRARVKACRLERSPYRHTQVSVEFVDIEVTQRLAIANHLERLAKLGNPTGTTRAA